MEEEINMEGIRKIYLKQKIAYLDNGKPNEKATKAVKCVMFDKESLTYISQKCEIVCVFKEGEYISPEEEEFLETPKRAILYCNPEYDDSQLGYDMTFPM